MKDEDVVIAIGNRKENAMNEVINKYSRLLWTIASAVLKNVGSEQDVEEVVADAFIFLWEYPGKFDPKRGSLKSLLCIVARSRAVDRYRELNRRSTLPLEEAVLADHFGMQEWLWQEETRRELLARFRGKVIAPAEPALIVDRVPEGVVFDETYPMELQYELVGQNYHSVDGYGRLVGGFASAEGSEKSLQLKALLPQREGEIGGGVYLPLIHMFTYDASAVREENTYAFLYGQILSFAEMEDYKVYEDEQYVVYEVTDLFYTDLDAYIDFFLTTRSDIHCDAQVRERVHSIYDYYKDSENLTNAFYYNLP